MQQCGCLGPVFERSKPGSGADQRGFQHSAANLAFNLSIICNMRFVIMNAESWRQLQQAVLAHSKMNRGPHTAVARALQLQALLSDYAIFSFNLSVFVG